MEILVFIQSEENKINPISLEALVGAQTIAKEIGANVSAATFSENTAELLKSKNLKTIILCNNQETNDYNPFPYLSSMEQIIKSKNPELIIFGHTYETRDWVPRLSARLDQPFLSDCISHKVDNGELIFTRSLYQNKVNVDIKSSGTPLIVSFQSGTFRVDNIESGSSETEVIDTDISDTNQITNGEKFKETEGGIDLTSADFIVSVGRGIGKEEHIPMVKELAQLIGAQLSSSRPVVDSGWLDHSLQIGSSGQTVSPKMYMALGISGAIQHVVGMKGSNCIIAINKDLNAPIFEIADYGVVADLHEIIPKLIESIKEQNG